MKPQAFNMSDGDSSFHGPNDMGYMIMNVRAAAEDLKRATELYCEGHHPHSNARVIFPTHHICVALYALGNFDRENCHYANKEHDPKLFAPHIPSAEARTRWDKTEGLV